MYSDERQPLPSQQFITDQERAVLLAERRSSRITSLVAALATGATITASKVIESGSVATAQVVSNFTVPIAVNTLTQFRFEREFRRLLGRAGRRRARIYELEQENQQLRHIIQAAGLEMPDAADDQSG